jgi:hypothetical protein
VLFAFSPGLESLPTEALQLLRDSLLGVIGFAGIACGIFNNVEDGGKLSVQIGVALQALKKVLWVDK